MATFGKTTNGSNSNSGPSNSKHMSLASPATAGKATSIKGRTWRTASGTTKAKGVIYADSAGAAGALLAVSDEVNITNTSEAELTFPLSGANQIDLAAGTNYWIGIIYDAPGTGQTQISTGTTSSLHRSNSDTYSDGPANPGGALGSSNPGPVDVYVEYTEYPTTKLHTLTDNFNDNSIDTAKWDSFASGAATVQETGKQLVLTPPSSNATVSYAGLVPDSGVLYNFADTYASIKVVQATGNNSAQTYMIVPKDSNNWVGFIKEGSLLKFNKKVAGVTTTVASVTYDPAVHVYWRVRESGGTTYWDTSVDGITWTNRASQANPFSYAVGVYVEIACGTFESVASPGFAIFDDFNLINFTGADEVAYGTSSATASGIPDFIGEAIAYGTSSAEAHGRQLSVPQDVEKKYVYKIYDKDGNYLGDWNDVKSEFGYSQEINSAGSAIEVELGRNSDSLIPEYEPRVIDGAEARIIDGSVPRVLTTGTINAVGPGSTVYYNNTVEVWVYYGYLANRTIDDDTERTTDTGEVREVAIGAPNGRKIFTGFISNYVSRYGGEEGVKVTVKSFGDDLDNYVIKSGAATEVAYNSVDPSNMFKDILDKFNAEGGLVTYDAYSVQISSTITSYTFNLNTTLEGLQRSVTNAPSQWFWRLDMGTNIAHLSGRPDSVSHTFILGEHIESLELEETMEGIANDVYISGGEVTAGVNLFKHYEDDASQENYRRGLSRISDDRLKVDESANIIGNGELSEKGAPRYRTTITILSEVYLIEEIILGQLVGFANFGNYVDDLTMQIVALTYTPEKVTLQLDTLLPATSKSLDDVRRQLRLLENANNPTTPA